MKRLALFLVSTFCILLPATEAIVTQAEIPCGSYAWKFDPKRLSSEDMEKYSQLHPYVRDWLGSLPMSNLCIDGDAHYQQPCGTRRPDAPNFEPNARINLLDAETRWKDLQRLRAKAPAELKPMIDSSSARLHLHVEIIRVTLRYLKTKDANVLMEKIDGIDPAAACPDCRKRAQAAKTDADRFQLANYDWANALNHAYRGPTPEEELAMWKKFLKRFAIREEHDQSACDDGGD